MATDIIMPNAGFDTQEARIVEWLVKPGDTIKKGGIIAVIESDKTNVELESLANGMVIELLYEANTDIPIGAAIARVGSSVEIATTTSIQVSAPPSAVAVPAATADDTYVSPVARRIAVENRLDLAKITGTGPRGRIIRDDVERHLKSGNGQLGIAALPKVRKAARQAEIDLAQVKPTGSAGLSTAASTSTILFT